MHSKRSIAFLDGGNAEIVRTADSSLALVRAACVVFRNNRRGRILRNQFYVLSRCRSSEGMLYCSSTVHAGLKEPDLLPQEEELEFGHSADMLDRPAEAARRIAELKLAVRMAGMLEEGDLLVLDGTLEASGFEKLMGELVRACQERSVLLCALAKTSALVTDTGYSAVALLQEMAPDGAWYYHPVAEMSLPHHRADLFFVKLHSRASHVFRFEVSLGQRETDLPAALGVLASSARDAAFPGYPYGLLAADRFARVGGREASYLNAKLTLTSKGYRELQRKVSAVSAHRALDAVNAER